MQEGFWRQPDTAALLIEHKSFTELLESLGCTVDVAPPVDGLVDAVYMHDPMIMTPHGAILLRMAKPIRSPEPAEFRKDLEGLCVPILGQLTDQAFADGRSRKIAAVLADFAGTGSRLGFCPTVGKRPN